MYVYLDNAATTQLDESVEKVMSSCGYGNPHSLHKLGREARKSLEEARKRIAQVLHASPAEVFFTSGGTESNNLVLQGLAAGKKGGHIVVSSVEHSSILQTCAILEKKGFKVTYLPVDKNGRVRISDVEAALQDDTLLVSVMHANNEIGTIQPVTDIYAVCKRHNVLFHTDAVQSFGKLSVDSSLADFISLSSHKIHGPKGVGALFVKHHARKFLHSILFGGGQEQGLRSGTVNVPGIVGFAEAVACFSSDDQAHVEKLRDMLISFVENNISGVSLTGGSPRLCNNVHLSVADVEGESLVLALDAAGVACGTGSACTQGRKKQSHVLQALQLTDKGSVRLTLSKYTTEQEVFYTCDVLARVISDLRKIR